MNNFLFLPTSLKQAFVLDLKLGQELTKHSDRLTFLTVSVQVLFSCSGSFFAESYCTDTRIFISCVGRCWAWCWCVKPWNPRSVQEKNTEITEIMFDQGLVGMEELPCGRKAPVLWYSQQAANEENTGNFKRTPIKPLNSLNWIFLHMTTSD